MPPARLLNLLMYAMMENRDEQERAKLEARLMRPPAGADPAGSVWDDDALMAQFRTAAGGGGDGIAAG